MYLSSAGGREALRCCQGWERCVFAQEELVLYLLAHTRRYKQNVHGLMKDQPAWKRCELERKRIFRERQEQILQHTELFLVNNIGYRSKIPFSVNESQVSQASSLLGNIFHVGCSQTRRVSLGRNSAPRHHTKVPPASVTRRWWAECHLGTGLTVPLL